MSDIGIIKKSKLEYPFSLRPHRKSSSSSSSPAISIRHSAIYDSMGFLVWVSHTHRICRSSASTSSAVQFASLVTCCWCCCFCWSDLSPAGRQTFRSWMAPHGLNTSSSGLGLFVFSLLYTLLLGWKIFRFAFSSRFCTFSLTQG